MGSRSCRCFAALLLAACGTAAPIETGRERGAPVSAAGSDADGDSDSVEPGTWVIVEVSVPATLSAFSRSRDEIDDERAAIREAQDRLLRQLTPAAAAFDHEARAEPPQYARFETVPYLAVRADSAQMTILRNSGLVVSIGPDKPCHALLTESAPLVHADAAWNAGYDGRGWTVAVIDTGVNFRHQFLAGRVVSGSCFTSGKSGGQCPCRGQALDKCVGAPGDPSPGYGGPLRSGDHGTHVAGIVGGSAASIKGVAPEATLVSERVFTLEDGERKAYPHDIGKALEDVLHNRSTQYRIAAVNLSLGGDVYDSREDCDADYPSILKVVTELLDEGIVVVAASGNDHEKGGLSFPAALTGVVAVGATDKEKRVADFSNSSSSLDLLAPGVGIRSSVNSATASGDFGLDSGTSMAAPHVAGAIAVLRQRYPTETAAEIVGRLRRTGGLVTDQRNGVQTPFIDVAAALK